MSRIEVQSPQGNVQEGQRLMIIEMGKYNETNALLIETDAIGSQGHICYWDGDWKVSVTMMVFCMGKEGTEVQT